MRAIRSTSSGDEIGRIHGRLNRDDMRRLVEIVDPMR